MQTAKVIDEKTAQLQTGEKLVILGIISRNVSWTIWDKNGPEKIKEVCEPGREMEIDKITPKGIILRFYQI